MNIKPLYIDGYYVSSNGQIFSSKIKGSCGKTNIENMREMTYKIDRYGYRTVCLSYIDDAGNQKRIYPTVHLLVYKTFVGPVPDGYHIDHIDRNRLNNNIFNLRIIPAYENSNMYRNGINLYDVYDFSTNYIRQMYAIEIYNEYGLSKSELWRILQNNGRSTNALRKNGINIIVKKSVEDSQRIGHLRILLGVRITE